MKAHINTIYNASVQSIMKNPKFNNVIPESLIIYEILKYQMNNAEKAGLQIPRNWSRQKGVNRIKYLLKIKGHADKKNEDTGALCVPGNSM